MLSHLLQCCERHHLSSTQDMDQGHVKGQGLVLNIQATFLGRIPLLPPLWRFFRKPFSREPFLGEALNFKVLNVSFLPDAQFFDDPADKYKEPEGTLLPLWEFDYDKTKGTVVTDIKWSPRYFDMFAASFGTCECHAVANLLQHGFFAIPR